MNINITIDKIYEILGEKQASFLLDFNNPKIPKKSIFHPKKGNAVLFLKDSDRNQKTLENLYKIYNHGRLKKTNYLYILPVDQDIEHNATYSFYKNPIYFDPENIIKLAIESGANAVVSSLGALGLFSKKYAHKIPFIVKINHNNSLIYPQKYNQILFANVEQAYNMGAVGIGATIYFGHELSSRQIQEISQAFYKAHELGMFTVLWCYVRNKAFKKDKNYQIAVDLTSQANRFGVTIEADIIKQKLPEYSFGFERFNYKYTANMYDNLLSEHPIDLVRYQLIHNYNGKIPLINSGGGSSKNDFSDAISQAIINKRAGGSGLIMGRKAFKKSFEDGINIIHAVQDIYLNEDIEIA